MAIAVGDTLPEATFRTTTADGPVAIKTSEIFPGKTVVLFSVPGAFTPTCHKNHLPGYIRNAALLKQKGVDTIAVVAVNDVFVMEAWREASGAGDKILFLSDGSADFAKAIGLELDGSAIGMGIRSKRFSMLVKDGKVASLNIEDAPGKAEQSGADTMLQQI